MRRRDRRRRPYFWRARVPTAFHQTHIANQEGWKSPQTSLVGFMSLLDPVCLQLTGEQKAGRVKLTAFGIAGSPYARRVQMALIEKGVPYKEHMMSFGNKDHKQDWYLELSPRGQVPLLVDNGKPLSQSLAILLYVEEKFPEAPLIPKDDVLAKSKVISFVCEMDDKLYGDVEHDVFSRALKKDVTEETLKEINEKADKELGIWESYLAKVCTLHIPLRVSLDF